MRHQTTNIAESVRWHEELDQFIVRTTRRRVHAHREVGALDAIDLDAGLHSQPFLVRAARGRRLSDRQGDGACESTRLLAAGIRRGR
jgi:hypothetical protein